MIERGPSLKLRSKVGEGETRRREGNNNFPAKKASWGGSKGTGCINLERRVEKGYGESQEFRRSYRYGKDSRKSKRKETLHY